MSDDALIRHANLARLCRARAWKAAELVTNAGRGYSFWAAMLQEGSKKSFGEKLARSIEQSLDLPRGWLDTAAEVPPQAVRESAPVYALDAWPFTHELRQAIMPLSGQQLVHLENVMRAHLKLPSIRPKIGRKAAVG